MPPSPRKPQQFYAAEVFAEISHIKNFNIYAIVIRYQTKKTGSAIWKKRGICAKKVISCLPYLWCQNNGFSQFVFNCLFTYIAKLHCSITCNIMQNLWNSAQYNVFIILQESIVIYRTCKIDFSDNSLYDNGKIRFSKCLVKNRTINYFVKHFINN